MILAVGDAVRGPIVARRRGDSDAQGSCRLAGGVKCGHGLGGPVDCSRAPRDRDHTGPVSGVVNGVSDGVDEPLVGVGRKVNDYPRAWSDGTGDFDVEHDLAVSTVGVSGVVLSGSYGDGYHLGWLLTQAFEVGRNVCLAKAASEFDDTNGLIGCSHAIRKLVELSDLHRRIGDIASGVGTGSSNWTKDAKVWFGLRTVVEAEDGDYVALKFGREMDAAFTNPVSFAFQRLVREGDAECLLHVGNCPAELDGAAPGCRRATLDGKAKLLGEALNELHGGGVCPMATVELSASEALFARDMLWFERRLASNNDRHGDAGGGGRGLFAGSLRERGFLAAGQYSAALSGEVTNGFFR